MQHESERLTQNNRQPLSGAKHFWLSFLAVVTGVPVSALIFSTGFFVLMIVFIALIASTVPGEPVSSVPTRMTYGSATAKHTIVSVPVRGVILSGSAADPLQTLFGQSYADGELIKEQLRTLAEDESVDAVVMEIDSPGGMITASKAIADGINYYKTTTKKPIYAHINGMGASGGYWVASSTDKIFAEQGSEAGSIGVIMGPLVTLREVVSYGGVSTNSPIGFKYYSAGRSKDLGNPFREITAEEEAYLNKQLNDEYEKFVTHVSTARNIPAENIKGDIGALAYGTNDALKFKLIDGVKSKEDVYAELAEKANIMNDYKVMQIDMAGDLFGSIFGVRKLISEMRTSEADKSAGRTRFCETTLSMRPLVYSGDIASVCK